MFIYYNDISSVLEYFETTGSVREFGLAMAMIESNRRYTRRCAENILTDFKDGEYLYFKRFFWIFLWKESGNFQKPFHGIET